MPYYIRILGTSDYKIHLDEIISVLKDNGLTAKFNLEKNENPNNWTVIDVSNLNDEYLMQIERNTTNEGVGKEEIEEFKEDILEYKPVSASKWLYKYLDKVKVIYAFQLLNASMKEENFSIIETIKSVIWSKVDGIFQADNEGFSNEDGYHILWQFSDNVTGEWNMAVKNFFGGWTNFKMDLGDEIQRKEFLAGKVPKNAKKL
ncbi:hypothetical protein [Chryseobacterium shigense]|uniref:Uncharacterized protein n=1 Tax=Chryseobacterium shigense TaxID=297244 RepID=A0A841NFX5_9FLAO|nr:hypothetical protein [Chryseobacterium shigense]MBB6372768.1 hypothetical protein [Chryseobacterium shigense]